MRRLCVLIALVFTMLRVGDAHAFCLFHCEPSEADAQKVFENIKHGQFKTIPFTVVSFKKTNGVTVTAPVPGYQMFFQAEIALPQGANPECNPQSGNILNNLVCGGEGVKYYPPGYHLAYSESFVFEKTEKGWLAPDGMLY